ncbi:hypothetical protein ACFQS9_19160 [Rhodococcus daqingensis]|uniref:Uncharacterized protein n=1 Tax=Rhodococcus daqingensis TaxID=2479363 RepID=A0ABW2S1Z4_9NOCA
MRVSLPHPARARMHHNAGAPALGRIVPASADGPPPNVTVSVV